jgi:hypothetical protein
MPRHRPTDGTRSQDLLADLTVNGDPQAEAPASQPLSPHSSQRPEPPDRGDAWEGDDRLGAHPDTAQLPPAPNDQAPAPPAGSSIIDLARLRTSQAFPGFAPTKVEQGTVPCDKPKADVFFRVNPDPAYQVCSYLLKPPTKGKDAKTDADIYFVVPDLWEQCLKARTPGLRWARLVVWVDARGNYGVWPLRERDGGREDTWMLSALTAAEKCQDAWGAVRSNMAIGCYDWEPLKVPDPPEPKFPDRPFDKIIEDAFKGRIITAWDHPKLRQLRGEML